MHKTIWTAARGKLKNSLDEDAFERWISVIEPISFKDGKLTLAVDNEMLKMWLENHYMPVIANAVMAHGAPGGADVLSVELVVDDRIAPVAAAAGNAPASAPVPARRAGASGGGGGGATANGAGATHSLNPAFTFAEFIVGNSNSFSHAGAVAVAAKPGRAYNPLLIYGDTGLGKTHLMQAIAHGVLAHTPKASVRYLTAEMLLNDFITSIHNATMPEFRARYRSADVLLVDDIHFIAGKKEIQEEFFNIYNALHNVQKQIVMTSDRPISKIQGLEERLVSRFQAGLVTDIAKPEFETRVAILRHKQQGFERKLPDGLLNFIGENIISNVRQLEGALVKATTYWNLTRKPVLTVDDLRDLLRDMIDQERRPTPTFIEIQKIVADDYDLRVADLMSKERPQSVALPRQIAMFLCRSLTNGSLPEIAKAFDKTHATIVHACKTILDRMETDSELKRRVHHLVERLGRDPATLPG
ncbi:MAG: chromosomal replication initiator protein DnaA [Kiritimatiellaeota bacterium]|nr:chromosomal replication initiator protein DnaA [Kiritimatiellota bacterium]